MRSPAAPTLTRRYDLALPPALTTPFVAAAPVPFTSAHTGRALWTRETAWIPGRSSPRVKPVCGGNGEGEGAHATERQNARSHKLSKAPDGAVRCCGTSPSGAWEGEREGAGGAAASARPRRVARARPLAVAQGDGPRHAARVASPARPYLAEPHFAVSSFASTSTFTGRVPNATYQPSAPHDPRGRRVLRVQDARRDPQGGLRRAARRRRTTRRARYAHVLARRSRSLSPRAAACYIERGTSGSALHRRRRTR